MSKATETKNMPQADGRSKKRPGLEEQKSIIVNAAVSLFVQHGSGAISISQICSEADVSRPTFYRCFNDKDELLSHIYQFSVNEHVEQIMLAGIKTKQVDKGWVQDALFELMDAIFERSDLAELVFMESNNPTSPAYEIVNTAFENIVDVLEKSITKKTKKKPSRIFLKSTLAANQWIVHNAIRSGLSKQDKQEAKEAAWELVSKLFGEKI